MINGSLSRRYAQALFELASQKGKVAEYGGALHELVELLAENEELARLFYGKVVAASAKKKLFARILSGQSTTDVLNFISLIIDKNREDSLADIAEAYDDLCDAAEGIRQVMVTSAVALGEEEKNALSAALAAKLGAKVRLKTAVDKKLIGGLKVQVGDTVYDASLSAQLAGLKKSLAV